jgi:DNA invertase Pin-like site-specific DNA recombinase
MLIGYARTSTVEQNADHQVDALVRAGIAERDVHVDVASGAKASRPELDLVLRLLRDGDTLVITRLDRLGRSLVHLVTLGAQLRDRGVGLRVLEQGIDTSTTEGRAMYGMLSVLAELQRELIVANTRDGLASARARGRVGGRKPKLTGEQAALAQQLYDAKEKTVQQIGDLFGVPRSTVYGYLTSSTASSTSPVSKPAEPGTSAEPPLPTIVAPQDGQLVLRKPDGHRVDQGPSRDPTTDPTVEPDAAATGRGRVVDLTGQIGPGWRLVQDDGRDRDSSTWRLERNGQRVGLIRRASTARGPTAWQALLTNGTQVPAAHPFAVTAGSQLWRTRNLGAAGIAHHTRTRPKKSRH